MKNNKLEIKKLNSFYGSSHILKNISFSLEENKVLSVVGKMEWVKQRYWFNNGYS